MISLNIEKTFGFISKEKVFAYEAEVKAAQEMLEKGTGKGNDFLGWLHLPSSITKELPEEFNLLKQQLSGFFNTKVQLTCSEKGKGKISIPFGNEEELERIMEIFDTLKK